ncbi:MAG TPA: aminoglycoside phosphotransferase family protein [Mycobacteriales bacterium]|nr:aminoglycoside phosphotransferase family protein [Mycobacteriales bacterium]
MTQPSPPPAQGVRVPYDELPGRVRGWVKQTLGSAVVSAVTQPGGFSPGVAARVVCADGSRAFVKAVSTDANPHSPDMHRREARITAALPPAAPAPRLLASYDDEGWVALLLEDVDGRHPHLPWQQDELRRVLDTVDELFENLTPSPLPDAPGLDASWRDEFSGWRDAAADGVPAGLDDWCVRHLDRLAELESRWVEAASGETLLHLDLRADNMLVSADRVWLVDWPWAARGAPVFDLAAFAPSVAMQGGPDPEELLAMSSHGRAADPDVLTVLVATITGYFLTHALLPPAPGLPTVRAFQAAQGAVALRWLQDLTHWS